jgi:hypothetical protein
MFLPAATVAAGENRAPSRSRRNLVPTMAEEEHPADARLWVDAGRANG